MTISYGNTLCRERVEFKENDIVLKKIKKKSIATCPRCVPLSVTRSHAVRTCVVRLRISACVSVLLVRARVILYIGCDSAAPSSRIQASFLCSFAAMRDARRATTIPLYIYVQGV